MTDPTENRRRRNMEAADWFAAVRGGAMSVETRAAFEAWCADPENRRALDRAHVVWGEMAILEDPRIAERMTPRRGGWKPAVVAAALLLCTGVGAYAVLHASPASVDVIETAVGQQRTQPLPDGSVVAVNVASRVSYAARSGERVVSLDEGEAAFAVRNDPKRPFRVRAGDYEVRAVGTSFNVRQRDGTLEVAVSEGRVEICRANARGAGDVLAVLEAGQKLLLPATLNADAPVRATIQAVDPSQVAAWRMRVVTYEDVEAAAVAADLSRFFEPPILIEEATLAQRRVTVRLQVNDRDHAVETFAAALGVAARETPQGAVLSQEAVSAPR